MSRHAALSAVNRIDVQALSGGKTHLRNVKVTELEYNADGTIRTIDPYIE